MKSLLKKGREQNGLTTREVSEALKIDQALISKFENGLRRPTANQIVLLSDLLGIDRESLTIEWLKERIKDAIGNSEFGWKALQAVANDMAPETKSDESQNQFQKLFDEMETLKSMLANDKKS